MHLVWLLADHTAPPALQPASVTQREWRRSGLPHAAAARRIASVPAAANRRFCCRYQPARPFTREKATFFPQRSSMLPSFAAPGTGRKRQSRKRALAAHRFGARARRRRRVAAEAHRDAAGGQHSKCVFWRRARCGLKRGNYVQRGLDRQPLANERQPRVHNHIRHVVRGRACCHRGQRGVAT